jgi:hypothetical protein
MFGSIMRCSGRDGHAVFSLVNATRSSVDGDLSACPALKPTIAAPKRARASGNDFQIPAIMHSLCGRIVAKAKTQLWFIFPGGEHP